MAKVTAGRYDPVRHYLTVPKVFGRLISFPIGEERAIFVTPTARGTIAIAGRLAASLQDVLRRLEAQIVHMIGDVGPSVYPSERTTIRSSGFKKTLRTPYAVEPRRIAPSVKLS